MSGGAAIALAVANLAAGLLNYLFQVHAAAVLDATAFGLLSAWLAQVTLTTAIATVIQFVSLDSPLEAPRLRTFLRVAGVVSAVVLAALVIAGYRASTLVLGAAAIAGPLLLCAVIGQLQARLRLADVAAAMLGMYVLRFALPFAWRPAERAPAFYVAHAATAYAGIAAAALLVALRRTPIRAGAGDVAVVAGVAAPGRRTLQLGRPILLAIATLLFPLVDVLVISTTHDAQTTGAFSRVALASRIVFFGGAAVLPILLPHQLHAAKTGAPLPPFVMRAERWLTPALIGGAVVLALIADRAVLRTAADERIWLFASCVAAALLVAILVHVQRFAARAQLGVATACVAGVVVTRALAAGLAAASLAGSAAIAGSAGAAGRGVTRYVLAVVAGDALVLLLATLRNRGSRSSSRDPEPALTSRP